MPQNTEKINPSFISSLLKEDPELLKNILEVLPIGVLILDTNGNDIHYANKKFTEILGYKIQDLKNFKDFIKLTSTNFNNYHDILTAWKAQLESLKDTTKPDNKEYKLVSKKGNTKNITLKPSLLNNSAILVLFEDITLQKLTQEAYNDTKEQSKPQNIRLEESKKEIKLNSYQLEVLLKLNEMTRNTISEISHFALEAALQLTNSSIGYLYLANKDETELTLAAWSKSVMKECTLIEKEVVYKVEETGLWGEAVRQRKPIITNDYQAQNPLKKGYPKGHVHLKSHMNIPVFEHSKIVAVAGVGNKEGDYEESDVIHLTILMQGLWRILQKKKAEEKIIRQNKELQIQEEELKEHQNNLEKTVQERTKQLIQTISQLKDKEEDLKQSNLKLQESNRHKDLFLTTMSHELRTPLNAVLGFSQSLIAQYFGTLNEKQLDYLNDIYNSAGHLLYLIDDIIDIATINAGKIQLNIKPTPIDKVIKDVVSMINGQLNTKNISLTLFIDPKLHTIPVDARRFKQILLNFLSNAIKYSNMNGNINLNITKTDNTYIKITITDQGAGIKKEDLDKIFTEFYQTDITRDKALGGMGIGLALCKRLTEMHNGTVGVESEYGKGSTFWFTLPIEQD